MPCGVTARDPIGSDGEVEKISAFLDHVERLPSALLLAIFDQLGARL
jgi:hypothetical protein